ncbi:winged helix-turn-helix domain-containing protein [Nonomuraea angiospora]
MPCGRPAGAQEFASPPRPAWMNIRHPRLLDCEWLLLVLDPAAFLRHIHPIAHRVLTAPGSSLMSCGSTSGRWPNGARPVGRAASRRCGPRDRCPGPGAKTLIGRLFRIGYTVEGVGKLLRRHGWSAEVWPAIKPPRRTWAPVTCDPLDESDRLGHLFRLGNRRVSGAGNGVQPAYGRKLPVTR